MRNPIRLLLALVIIVSLPRLHAQISSPATIVNVVSAGTASLLHGCTVSTSNTVNYNQTGCPASAPTGWTVVFSDGASNGLIPGEVLSQYTNANCTMPGSGPAPSYCVYYQTNGAEVAVYSPKFTAASNMYYMSFWDYVDTNAFYPNSDYQNGGFIPYWGSGSTCGSGVPVGAQNAQSYSILSYANGAFSPTSIGAASSLCAGAYTLNSAYIVPMNQGIRRQYEMLYIPNTTVALPESNPLPATCPTTTTPGCGNGTLKIWVNGNQVEDKENYNFNSTNTVNQVLGFFGGYLSSQNAQDMSCPNLNTSCPGPVPGTGAPYPFHRYINSLIFMTQ